MQVQAISLTPNEQMRVLLGEIEKAPEMTYHIITVFVRENSGEDLKASVRELEIYCSSERSFSSIRACLISHLELKEFKQSLHMFSHFSDKYLETVMSKIADLLLDPFYGLTYPVQDLFCELPTIFIDRCLRYLKENRNLQDEEVIRRIEQQKIINRFEREYRSLMEQYRQVADLPAMKKLALNELANEVLRYFVNIGNTTSIHEVGKRISDDLGDDYKEFVEKVVAKTKNDDNVIYRQVGFVWGSDFVEDFSSALNLYYALLFICKENNAMAIRMAEESLLVILYIMEDRAKLWNVDATFEVKHFLGSTLGRTTCLDNILLRVTESRRRSVVDYHALRLFIHETISQRDAFGKGLDFVGTDYNADEIVRHDYSYPEANYYIEGLLHGLYEQGDVEGHCKVMYAVLFQKVFSESPADWFAEASYYNIWQQAMEHRFEMLVKSMILAKGIKQIPEVFDQYYMEHKSK